MRKGEEEGNLPIDSDRGVQALRVVIQANGERLWCSVHLTSNL